MTNTLVEQIYPGYFGTTGFVIGTPYSAGADGGLTVVYDINLMASTALSLSGSNVVNIASGGVAAANFGSFGGSVKPVWHAAPSNAQANGLGPERGYVSFSAPSPGGVDGSVMIRSSSETWSGAAKNIFTLVKPGTQNDTGGATNMRPIFQGRGPTVAGHNQAYWVGMLRPTTDPTQAKIYAGQHFGSPANLAQAPDLITPNEWVLVHTVIADAGVQVRVNGGTLSGAAPWFNIDAPSFECIAGYWNAVDAGFAGDIARVMRVDEVLTDNQRAKIEAQIWWEAGLQDRLPETSAYYDLGPQA